MNKKFVNSMKSLFTGFIILSAGFMATGCQEIEEENRFTFKGELIADHLQNNPERFSHFVGILNKAKIGKEKSGSILKTLSTYGSYTCFAPTNEAVEKFVKENYETYKNSVDAHAKDNSVLIVNTGIKSPDVEEISDSMAAEIAKNHIIEMGYRTFDVNEGSFPKVTMNRRSTQITWPKNDDGPVFAVLNNSARIIEQDIETENGYIQVIDAILNPSNKMLPDLIASHAEFRLFSEAIYATGLNKLLETYEIDPEYDGQMEGPKFETQKNSPTPYPEEKHQKFTVLIETNDLLADASKNALNKPINTLEDLVELAEYWYGDNAKGEYTNPDNALYKYVAYHIIDRQLHYSSGTGPGGFIMENYVCDNGGKFNSEVNLPTTFDRYDYFETMLPYTMIKVTKPFTNSERRQSLVINYAQDGGTRLINEEMEDHINVTINSPSTTNIANFQQEALNGMIHTLDKILIYNEDEMRGNILRERMRWDIISIFPELTSNGVRWMPSQANTTLTYIPDGYSTRLVVNNTDTHIYYLRPHATGLGGYASWMGDELLVTGKYDFKYRLPYVPEGDYEIRFGFSQSNARGVCQFYLDNKICGIPVDMRTTKENEAFIGWIDDSEMTEEEIRAYDKALRNKGYMKAPASCHLTDKKESMRATSLALRKIIGIFRLTANDHWLRFKDVTESSTGKLNEFNQDYLEIVPVIVINDPAKPEDQY